MNNYSYIEAVTADTLDAIRENYTAEEIAEAMKDREEFVETLNDELWIDDSVTGNASGSYTMDAQRAKEYVMADTESVIEAVKEFCCGMNPAELAQKFFNEEWEYFDVTARCYYLSQAIENALDTIEKEAE